MTPTKALVDQWLALDARKRALKEELEQVEKDLKPIEQSVLDAWNNEGTEKLTDGKTNRTVYMFIESRPKVNPLNRQRMVEALKANGLASLVKEDFNLNSLRSVMLGWLEDTSVLNPDDAIPDAFRGLMEVSTTVSLRSCPAKQSKNNTTKGNDDEPF